MKQTARLEVGCAAPVRIHPVLPVLVLGAACAGPRYTTLPEVAPLAHDFATLDRHFVSVKVEGREAPVVLSWVEAGEGPPLLLVHGLMTSAYSFRYVISTLAKSYRVLAIDLPGAGRSAAPVDLSQSPQSQVAVLEAFARTLKLEKLYVVGNSLGGYVSLWWALAHPERFDRLVVMHSPGFPELRLYALHAFRRPTCRRRSSRGCRRTTSNSRSTEGTTATRWCAAARRRGNTRGGRRTRRAASCSAAT